MISRESADFIAEQASMTVYDPQDRPAQEGDILLFETARDRTPISIVDWAVAYWNEPPAMEKTALVIGDYDVVRINAETGKPIHKRWAKAYIAGPICPELVTFDVTGPPRKIPRDILKESTSYVLSSHESSSNPMKRVIACLMDGLAVQRDLPPGHPDPAGMQALREEVEEFTTRLPPETLEALLKRYRDAPLLLSWVAPEYENLMGRAFVRCAMSGGKAKGERCQNLPDSIEVPLLLRSGDHLL